MTRETLLLSGVPPAIQRYGLAVLSVAVGLGVGLLLFRYDIQGVEFPIFLISIVVTAWYAGLRPAIVALVLSALAFNYYFTQPYYSFRITRADIPYYVTFLFFAGLSTWFSASRRDTEQRLVRSSEELKKEMATRTQQASLLNLTHDPIFVR